MGQVSRRVATALPLAAAALAAIWWLDNYWLALGFAVITLLGAWEWGRLCGLSLARNTFYVLIIAGCVSAIYFSDFHLDDRWAVPGFLWWLAIALWVTSQSRVEKPRALPRWLRLIAGVLTLVLAWASLTSLHAISAQGAFWLTLLFALVWGSDTGAFFSGRRWGHHSLAPAISPGKTWEGFAGGLLIGVIIALLIYAAGSLQGLALPSISWVLPVCVMVIGFSVVGDLAESLLKRQIGAKDSGHLLPGHGGVLDRVDALLAAAPVLAMALTRVS